MRKAEKMGLPSLCKRVYDTYEELLTGKSAPKYTLKEAKKLLEELTPWE